MILTTHLDYLREQLAKAERVADGWRAIVSYAEANAIGTSLSMARPCDCGLPGTPGMIHRNDGLPCTPVPPDSGVLTGQHPYPSAAGQGDPRSAWTPRQEQRFQAFEDGHRSLCKDGTGPEKADLCVLDVGHDGKHDDGLGHSWAPAVGSPA